MDVTAIYTHHLNIINKVPQIGCANNARARKTLLLMHASQIKKEAGAILFVIVIAYVHAVQHTWTR